MFVGYTLAVLSILGTAKVAVALLVLGVPIIDTFWIIVRRLLAGPLAVHAGPRPHPPPPAGPRACRIARRSCSSTRSASVLAVAVARAVGREPGLSRSSACSCSSAWSCSSSPGWISAGAPLPRTRRTTPRRPIRRPPGRSPRRAADASSGGVRSGAIRPTGNGVEPVLASRPRGPSPSRPREGSMPIDLLVLGFAVAGFVAIVRPVRPARRNRPATAAAGHRRRPSACAAIRRLLARARRTSPSEAPRDLRGRRRRRARSRTGSAGGRVAAAASRLARPSRSSHVAPHVQPGGADGSGRRGPSHPRPLAARPRRSASSDGLAAALVLLLIAAASSRSSLPRRTCRSPDPGGGARPTLSSVRCPTRRRHLAVRPTAADRWRTRPVCAGRPSTSPPAVSSRPWPHRRPTEPDRGGSPPTPVATPTATPVRGARRPSPFAPRFRVRATDGAGNIGIDAVSRQIRL